MLSQLFVSNEKIHQRPDEGRDASKHAPQYLNNGVAPKPFLPGQLYLIRHMGIPSVCTILERGSDTVRWYGGEDSLRVFNMRIICYLGHRASLFGFWLPWAKLRPTLLCNDLPDEIANNRSLWCITHYDMHRVEQISSSDFE